MNIRKAKLEDTAAIGEIVKILHLDIPDFVWTNEDFIKKQIEKGEYYVAEEKHKVNGIISFRMRNEIFYIETLAVAKNTQTKGIGSKLVEFAKQFAKEKNFKIMRVGSFYEYGVKDFYIKLGFRLLPEPGEYGGHKFHRLEIEV